MLGPRRNRRTPHCGILAIGSWTGYKGKKESTSALLVSTCFRMALTSSWKLCAGIILTEDGAVDLRTRRSLAIVYQLFEIQQKNTTKENLRLALHSPDFVQASPASTSGSAGPAQLVPAEIMQLARFGRSTAGTAAS